MVLASLSEYFSPTHKPDTFEDADPGIKVIPHDLRDVPRADQMEDDTAEEGRPPYIHAIIAGGIGGLAGDTSMHSLDTVKTRQQGDPYRPPKYHSFGNTYYSIFRQEGVRRGLYSGITSAAIGSFGGTCIFFGFYEYSKRLQIDNGITPTLAYLNAGVIADVFASPIYVPTEVIKTRMQLQGRHNNPHFKSGYNYKGLWDAVRTIVRTEGVSALYYGYRATLWRDVPFSALQFTFYERERQAAKWWSSTADISFGMEVLVALTAGGAAGMLTTPLDVVKTRIQTQVNEPRIPAKSTPSPSSSASQRPPVQDQQPRTASSAATGSNATTRPISTSSSSSGARAPGTVILKTASTIVGLRTIYQTEGLMGWFRGVGPRTVWTSVQTGFMLVLYQYLLKELDKRFPVVSDDE